MQVFIGSAFNNVEFTFETSTCLFSETIRLMRPNLFELVFYHDTYPTEWQYFLKNQINIHNKIVWTQNTEWVSVYIIDTITISKNKVALTGKDITTFLFNRSYLNFNYNLPELTTVAGCSTGGQYYTGWYPPFSAYGEHPGWSVGCVPAKYSNIYSGDTCNITSTGKFGWSESNVYRTNFKINELPAIIGNYEAASIGNLVSLTNKIDNYNVDFKPNSLYTIYELIQWMANSYYNTNLPKGTYYMVKPIFSGNRLAFTVIVDKIENNTIQLQPENYDDWSVKTDFTEVVDVAPVIPSNPGELDQYKPILYCFHAIAYNSARTYNYGGLGYQPISKGQRIIFNPQTGQTTTPKAVWSIGSGIYQGDNFFDINFNPDGLKKWGSGIWTCTTDFNGVGNMRNDENPSQRIQLNGLSLGNWKPYKSSVSQSFGKEKQNGRVNVTNRDPDQKIDIMHHHIGRPPNNGDAGLPTPYDRNASLYNWEDVYLGSYDIVNKKHKETIAIDNIYNPIFEETNNVSDAWKVGSKIVLSEFEMAGKSSDVVLSEFNLIHGGMNIKYKFSNNVDELKSLFTTTL